MNVITLTGRLHNDPVRRETAKGIVATFRLAVNANRHRLWIDVEAWGQLAGTVHSHLAKGRHVAVTGSLRHTQYSDRDQQRRDHWYVAADRISFLEPPMFDPTQDEEALNGHVQQVGQPDHQPPATTVTSATRTLPA